MLRLEDLRVAQGDFRLSVALELPRAARLAVLGLEGPEPGQLNAVALLECSRDGIERGVEVTLGVGLAPIGCICDCVHEF